MKMESGMLCFCSNTFDPTQFRQQPDMSQCQAACGGDPTQICGGYGFYTVSENRVIARQRVPIAGDGFESADQRSEYRATA
jgi:hypothetical protein